MKVILTKTVEPLGEKGDVVDVADGYARNYLVPKKFAVKASEGALKQADAMRVARMQRAEEQAGKAPLKMMFPTIIIFAATLLVTLGPGMVQLMAFFGQDR